MNEPTKITPAMLDWCRYLAQPGHGLRRSSFTRGYHATTTRGDHRKQGLTYVMGLKLEKAGLIRWIDQFAELTDQGREAATQK